MLRMKNCLYCLCHVVTATAAVTAAVMMMMTTTTFVVNVQSFQIQQQQRRVVGVRFLPPRYCYRPSRSSTTLLRMVHKPIASSTTTTTKSVDIGNKKKALDQPPPRPVLQEGEEDISSWWPHGTTTTTPLLFDITLPEHRSLGCVIEESLATTSSTSTTTTTSTNTPTVVFVSSITPNGAADRAGLQVGDVIVGITGIFGSTGSGDNSLENVAGQSMNLIKSRVMSCPDQEPLVLRVVRGTTVLADHEAALTELCANPDTSDADVEQCVLDYIQGGYMDIDNETNNKNINNNDEEEEDCNLLDTQSECYLDNLQSMWAEEIMAPIVSSSTQLQSSGKTLSSSQASSSTQNATTTSTTTKPWSSRTSPSGTYVRDPTTGQMRNIG